MEILETILVIIYVIVCLATIAITLMQSKDDEGVSGTIIGGSSSSFYEKNKGRTTEGRLKRLTIILGIVFIILTVIIGILYMI